MHNCKNPIYSNDANTSIDVEYEHPVYGWIPFTATPDDVESLGVTIFEAAQRGDYGEVAPYVEPEPQYKTRFSVPEFRDRFTIDEQLAIRQAQFDDMEVGLVYDTFQASQFIDLEDPRVEQGIDLYVTKGLLDAGRKAELLEPEPIN